MGIGLPNWTGNVRNNNFESGVGHAKFHLPLLLSEFPLILKNYKPISLFTTGEGSKFWSGVNLTFMPEFGNFVNDPLQPISSLMATQIHRFF